MRFFRSDQGSALLEFSLITPVVVFIFMGIVDLGLMIERSMVLTEASHMGAQYGLTLGHASDLSGMQNAAFASLGTTNLAGATGSIVASNWCACTPGGSAVACTSTCSTYPTPIQYVQVKTTASVPILYGYPGLPGSFTLQSQSILRAP